MTTADNSFSHKLYERPENSSHCGLVVAFELNFNESL